MEHYDVVIIGGGLAGGAQRHSIARQEVTAASLSSRPIPTSPSIGRPSRRTI
jgi:flavin-dependent dehydrogenase